MILKPIFKILVKNQSILIFKYFDKLNIKKITIPIKKRPINILI